MANTFANLTEESRASVGQCCGHKHAETSTKKHVDITHQYKLTPNFYRNFTTKLWHFDLKKKINKTKENVASTTMNNTMSYIIPKNSSEKS